MTAFHANAFFLGVLAFAWCVHLFVQSECQPTSVTRAIARAPHITALENRFSTRRGEPEVAEQLVRAYLELDEPERAIRAMALANANVLEDAHVLYRLSYAYERSGRVEDALLLAATAAQKCENQGDVPEPLQDGVRRCSQRVRMLARVHVSVLARMRLWGITDPRHDARTAHAYSLSMRTATIMRK